MKFRLTYREDTELGGYGWVVKERDNEYFQTAQVESDNYSRLLVHDMVEHLGTDYDPCSDEIVAIGSTLFIREQDFYNRYTGKFNLRYEIADMLRGLYEENLKLHQCGSYSPEVSSIFTQDEYLETIKALKDEISEDNTISGLKNKFPRKDIIALLSKGYNRQMGIATKYDVDMEWLFSRVRSTVESAINMIDFPEYQDVIISFNYATKIVSYYVKDDPAMYSEF